MPWWIFAKTCKRIDDIISDPRFRGNNPEQIFRIKYEGKFMEEENMENNTKDVIEEYDYTCDKDDIIKFKTPPNDTREVVPMDEIKLRAHLANVEQQLKEVTISRDDWREEAVKLREQNNNALKFIALNTVISLIDKGIVIVPFRALTIFNDIRVLAQKAIDEITPEFSEFINSGKFKLLIPEKDYELCNTVVSLLSSIQKIKGAH